MFKRTVKSDSNKETSRVSLHSVVIRSSLLILLLKTPNVNKYQRFKAPVHDLATPSGEDEHRTQQAEPPRGFCYEQLTIKVEVWVLKIMS